MPGYAGLVRLLFTVQLPAGLALDPEVLCWFTLQFRCPLPERANLGHGLITEQMDRKVKTDDAVINKDRSMASII